MACLLSWGRGYGNNYSKHQAPGTSPLPSQFLIKRVGEEIPAILFYNILFIYQLVIHSTRQHLIHTVMSRRTIGAQLFFFFLHFARVNHPLEFSHDKWSSCWVGIESLWDLIWRTARQGKRNLRNWYHLPLPPTTKTLHKSSVKHCCCPTLGHALINAITFCGDLGFGDNFFFPFLFCN